MEEPEHTPTKSIMNLDNVIVAFFFTYTYFYFTIHVLNTLFQLSFIVKNL